MNIHEFQAKQLLARAGVPIPPGRACATVEAVQSAAQELFGQGHRAVALKSQIHAGGRGKGTFKNGLQGGVKVCGTVREAIERAEAMLGQVLVTKQTGPEGRRVRQLLVEAASPIEKEFYLAALLDRASGRPVVMASAEGGMDIEEVAAKTPEKILRESVDPATGLLAFQARKIAAGLGLRGNLILQGAPVIAGVFKTWWDSDASLVELNPLAITRAPQGPKLVALDAKISLDDNGLYRHPDIQAMRDLGEEAPLEIEASKFSLNYIKLDGNIACLVNGAGLAMATMDIIQHYRGRPANFLDVGGGASQEQVAAAFRIILSDPNVKGILVNIFGGIMQCDIIAAGIVAAAKETGLTLPLVVRLEGNNVEIGKRILAESKLPLLSADSMAAAAEKVAAAVG